MQRGPNLNQTSCRGASVRSSQGEKNKETDTSDLQNIINLIFKVKFGLDGKQDSNYHESGTISIFPLVLTASYYLRNMLLLDAWVSPVN